MYICSVKKIMIIIILAIFLKPILPVIDYIINYDYISKVLCENKAKPELKCNGKCHLMKELAKASENEKPINSDKKDNSKQEIEVLFFQEIEIADFGINYGLSKFSINANYSDTYAFLTNNSVFHPPIIIS